MWRREKETLTRWSFYPLFCSLRMFIYCLKMQTRFLTRHLPVSPIFSLYTMRISIDEIFAFWRGEYKHLIKLSWVCAYAWPSSIIIIIVVVVLNMKREKIAVLPIIESDLYPFFSWFFSSPSFLFWYTTRRTTKLIVQGKRCVLNTTISEFTSVLFWMTDRSINKLFHCSRSRSRTMTSDIIHWIQQDMNEKNSPSYLLFLSKSNKYVVLFIYFLISCIGIYIWRICHCYIFSIVLSLLYIFLHKSFNSS